MLDSVWRRELWVKTRRGGTKSKPAGREQEPKHSVEIHSSMCTYTYTNGDAHAHTYTHAHTHAHAHTHCEKM
jgi:hypothetical protein